MRKLHHTSVLAAALALACGVGLATAGDGDGGKSHAGDLADAKFLGHKVIGGGYAAFESDGAPGDNSYWVFAQGIGRWSTGRWYADVYIDYGGFQFDFEALYTVDCLEVDRTTREAWIGGTIIESNDPANVGNRAFLYVRDGGSDGPDL